MCFHFHVDSQQLTTAVFEIKFILFALDNQCKQERNNGKNQWPSGFDVGYRPWVRVRDKINCRQDTDECLFNVPQ